ncbi:MAG: hypothetical protein GY896_23075 [Gammaproteobacteria bacterium]|nr:hypothetical protein [Gammaproteobacteria bacterium]
MNDKKQDNVFNIPTENLAALLSDLQKLSKRAAKLGLEDALTWSAGDTFQVEKVIARGHKKIREYTPITVNLVGDIKLPGGWHLVATLDHRSAETPIILSVPGEELPTKYRSTGPDCNHCKLDRRRNDTFVIRDEQGEYKQVGRTCIADYLGHKDALNIARAYQYLAQFVGSLRDEDSGYYRSAPSIWALDDCLAFTAALVRLDGWAPRSAGTDGAATADQAWNWFLQNFEPIKTKRGSIHPPEVIEKDTELAAKALAWLDVQDPTKAKSDYLYNVQAITKAGTVTRRTIGLAASIIGTYKRVVERELRYARERKEKYNGKPSEWVGEVKKRIKGLEIEVFGTYEAQGDYGVYTRVVFKDAEGNEFVWFASGYTDLEAGQKYIIDATVKKHNEFKGKKQTQVNRVTVKQGLLQ